MRIVNTFDNSNIFKYRNICRKIHKENKKLVGLVDDHHVIPQSLKNHELLKLTNFNIDQNYNLCIMPNSMKTIELLNLKENTLIHIGGHLKYNTYVKKQLNIINKYKSYDQKCYKLWLFLHYLRKNLKFNEDNIPWN